MRNLAESANERVRNLVRVYLSDSVTKASFVILLGLVMLGIFGPLFTENAYDTIHTDANGAILRLEPPSSEFWLGTTTQGHDVFARVVFGARATLLTGFVGGLIIITIGSVIGIVSGYYGGATDGILMRFTDFMYSIPVIPMALVLIAFFGIGFWEGIFIVGLLLWRSNARVFRSQVLKLKERPYVNSARAIGASDRHIIVRHILPNLGGLVALFFALGIGVTILIMASLAFLGVVSPFLPSWGVMLRNAYNSGVMYRAWWWALPPGFLIALTVLCTFLIGRGFERAQEIQQGNIQ